MEVEDGCAGGVIIGDLPPTEAFPIGGTNSVRGYAEGGVGSARNFLSGNAELRCPLFGQLEVCPQARQHLVAIHFQNANLALQYVPRMQPGCPLLCCTFQPCVGGIVAKKGKIERKRDEKSWDETQTRMCIFQKRFGKLGLPTPL